MRNHDLIVIDDVLDDPKVLTSFAKSVYYYSDLDSSVDKPEGLWQGYRSKTLGVLNHALFEKTMTSILERLFVIREKIKVNFSYDIRANFHYLTHNNIADSSWIHRDTFLYTGVLYLNENPMNNSGTCLYDENMRLTSVVENKYNRLVLFNSTMLHSAQSGFGTDVFDSRLSLVLFVKMFSMQREDLNYETF